MSALKNVSLVLAIHTPIASDLDLFSKYDSEHADEVIKARGRRIHTWLNHPDHDAEKATRVCDGIYAIRVPHETPKHLALLIGRGIGSFHFNSYVVVVLKNFNL